MFDLSEKVSLARDIFIVILAFLGIVAQILIVSILYKVFTGVG